MKRLTDIVLSLMAIVLLSPVFLFISLYILLESRGGIFYRQQRIGKNSIAFTLFKFRTMRPDAEKSGLISFGEGDPRITGAGQFLRKYKLDELPQLFNILRGDMSVVGPRPEVPKYVSLYSNDQLEVLSVRPGLTDFASLEYFEEGEILARSEDPEKTYIEEILPHKLSLGLKYVREQSFGTDMKIILRTFLRVIRR